MSSIRGSGPRKTAPTKHTTPAKPSARTDATQLDAPPVPAAARAAAPRATPPPSRVVKLPAGYPAELDLGKAAEGVAEILRAQGADPSTLGRGVATTIVFTDADLTLFEAPPIPTYLKHKETGALLTDPETRKPVRLGVGPSRDPMKELVELKAKRADVDFGAYNLDFREFSGLANILSAEPILPTIHSLKRANQDPGTRSFVVTARGDHDDVALGISRFLERADVRTDGTFMIYHPEHQRRIGLDARVEGQARKKALAMAAVLHLFDPAMAKIREVRFVDDNDDNLRAARELLPALFPHIRFELVDVVHKGGGVYEHHVVPKDARAYRSEDAPFAPAPAPIEFWKTGDAYGQLSNFADYPITLGGKQWPTSEHYFQAQKFAGTPHEEEVRNAPTPMAAAEMGRDHARPLRADWEAVKEQVMLDALRAKFTQHPALRSLLLDTGNHPLVEASPKDRYWGDGADGTGKNRLGELLMLLRAELKAELKAT